MTGFVQFTRVQVQTSARIPIPVQIPSNRVIKDRQPVFSYFTGTGEVERSRAMRSFAAKVFLLIGFVYYLLIVFFSRYFFSIFNPNGSELIDLMCSRSLPY